jgi:hypothetical protein
MIVENDDGTTVSFRGGEVLIDGVPEGESMNQLVLTARHDGRPVRILVSDLDGFVHAGGEEHVVVYVGDDGDENPYHVRKHELRDLAIEGEAPSRPRLDFVNHRGE